MTFCQCPCTYWKCKGIKEVKELKTVANCPSSILYLIMRNKQVVAMIQNGVYERVSAATNLVCLSRNFPIVGISHPLPITQTMDHNLLRGHE